MADAVEEIERDGGNRAVKDLFAGAVGGIAQVLIGQPFDIVKVRLQTTTQYSGAADAASSILKNEGATAFYKGTLTPLIGIGACNAAKNGGLLETPQPLSYGQYYAAGAFAGIANTLMSSPIEHIRIRLQTQPHGAARLYNGPIDCVKKLCAHEGVLKGLYRGTGVTWLREAQAYGVWFTAFEFMMNQDAKRNGLGPTLLRAMPVSAGTFATVELTMRLIS
ncbi:unnamed protein product [Aureobasidium mustum]|uniref:Mitochondrial carrier n=1 Tax=Aureobasidium mustum TaxID=2773714 RepID=A0A9N8JDH5_9PEZI|nr:unnamed protein product [Aureobasidium mustum]